MTDWADQAKAIVARVTRWLEDDSRPVSELHTIWDQVAAALRTAHEAGRVKGLGEAERYTRSWKGSEAFQTTIAAGTGIDAVNMTAVLRRELKNLSEELAALQPIPAPHDSEEQP